MLLQTTRCDLRLTVSRYRSAHIWDLRFAGGSSRQTFDGKALVTCRLDVVGGSREMPKNLNLKVSIN